MNGFMQTSVPNVYACGDITAFSLLAHTAVSEAEVAVDHILGKNRSMSYKAIPGVVYTNPEQSPGWIGIGHVWGIKYQSASLRISPTVGCGKTMDFSSEAFMPFSTAIPAMTISSEAGFPKRWAPMIVSSSAKISLQTPLPCSFSATKRPENAIGIFLTV